MGGPGSGRRPGVNGVTGKGKVTKNMPLKIKIRLDDKLTSKGYSSLNKNQRAFQKSMYKKSYLRKPDKIANELYRKNLYK